MLVNTKHLGAGTFFQVNYISTSLWNWASMVLRRRKTRVNLAWMRLFIEDTFFSSGEESFPHHLSVIQFLSRAINLHFFALVRMNLACVLQVLSWWFFTSLICRTIAKLFIMHMKSKRKRNQVVHCERCQKSSSNFSLS